MELELCINVEPEDPTLSTGLRSPMGGKHQRKLSLSAKWANNKALALEYLRREREVMLWIENVLETKLPTKDLFEGLKSGVVLRELLKKLFPDISSCLSPINRNYTAMMAPWKERENISIFLKQCKALGMNDLSLFCTDDLYEGTNLVQVLFCVQDFMKFSEEHSDHLFQPITQEHQDVTFSNQEVEHAMSKIEMAGMDASAMKDLLTSHTPSPSAHKAASTNGDSPDNIDTEASSLSEDEKRPAEPVVEDEETTLQALEYELVSDENASDGERDCNQSNDMNVDIQEKAEAAPETIDDTEEHDSESSNEQLEDQDKPENTVDEREEEIPVAAEERSEHAIEPYESEAYIEEAGLDIRSESNPEATPETERSPLVVAIEADNNPALETEVVIAVPEQHLESEPKSELTGVSNIDSAVNASAEAEQRSQMASESESLQQETKPILKSPKATKTKKTREASDEQLDVEAMSRCTCGNKCSIM